MMWIKELTTKAFDKSTLAILVSQSLTKMASVRLFLSIISFISERILKEILFPRFL